MKKVFGKALKTSVPTCILLFSGAVFQEAGITNPELEQAIRVVARSLVNLIWGGF